jgi:plasmid stability protein
MAQLLVRDLEDRLVRALKERAARAGRSAEAEHREILRDALTPRRGRKVSFNDFLRSMPDSGDDADFERVRDYGRKPPRL